MRDYILFFCLFVAACSGTSVPADVLPLEKMEHVLYDVIRADEMVDFLKMTDSAWQPFSRRTALYDTVFQLHGVNKDEFQKSLSYYQQRPDLLKEIIDGMQKKATDTATAAQQRLRIEQRPPVQ